VRPPSPFDASTWRALRPGERRKARSAPGLSSSESTKTERGARIDAIRKKFNDVLSLRLPRLRMPDLALSATIGRGLWGRHRSRRVVETWWASHRLGAVVWTLGVVSAVVVGLVVVRF
jgi:hypothetical protein